MPRITVKAELADLQVNRDLGSNRLKAFLQKLEHNMHRSRGQPLGITVGAASAWYRTGIRYAKRQHGGYCVWLDKAEVSIGFEHLTIYIDRKYSKGSCEYETVLEHEMDHVKINRDMIQAYLPQVQEALARAVRAKPHIRVLGTLRQARDSYLLHLRHAVKPLLKQMESERGRRNARIDTPESYRRILRRCTNW